MLSEEEIKFRNIIAKNVRHYRELKNLTQYQLTIDAEITRNQIGRIERSEINTTAFTLHKIAKALKVDLFQLLENNNNPMT